MANEIIYYIIIGAETALLILSFAPTIIRKIRFAMKGKNTIRVFYFGQNNEIQTDRVKIGTEKSALEIIIGDNSFIFDPQRVYKFPPGKKAYSNEQCLFFTYKSCKPVNFHDLFPKQDKTPEELYAMLRTKMFKELMAGNNDLMKPAMSMLVICVIIGGVYFLAKSMGWIG